jgi:hypothetical protein
MTAFGSGELSAIAPLLTVAFIQAGASQPNPDSANRKTTKQPLATSLNRPICDISALFTCSQNQPFEGLGIDIYQTVVLRGFQ